MVAQDSVIVLPVGYEMTQITHFAIDEAAWRQDQLARRFSQELRQRDDDLRAVLNVEHSWEARRWRLAHDLAVAMVDRCQDGLMTPAQFGELAADIATAVAVACASKDKEEYGDRQRVALARFLDEMKERAKK